MREGLIRARHKAGFTQVEAAEGAEISRRHYQGLEAGSRNASYQVWRRIADLFDTSVEAITETESQRIMRSGL